MAKKLKQLPADGDAFAFQFDDGRYGVCRVLRSATSLEVKQNGENCVLVACSSWIGDVLPDIGDKALRPILHLTHHSWDNQPEMLWVSDPPPKAFMPIGNIKSTPNELAIKCHSFGAWASMKIQRLAQWRWDHDREAIMAEEQAKEQEAVQHRQAEREADADRAASVTLNSLQSHRFFQQWKNYPPKDAIRASRRIMSKTVNALSSFGADPTEDALLPILQDCIESFNRIDKKFNNFIGTIEREDICEEFDKVVAACGLDPTDDLAESWRDW